LRPGIKGVSENINVISIIGKYLEHPRAFYFKNDTNQVYISSADWMPRNLIRRIELLTAIKEEYLKQKIIQILKLQCADNATAHKLQSDGSYIKVKPQNDYKPVNNHKLLEEYVNKIAKASKKDTPSQVQQLAQRLFVES
jgi:polyphosphate kinase